MLAAAPFYGAGYYGGGGLGLVTVILVVLLLMGGIQTPLKSETPLPRGSL
jgi:Protein of unknown function (DUF3309)